MSPSISGVSCSGVRACTAMGSGTSSKLQASAILASGVQPSSFHMAHYTNSPCRMHVLSGHQAEVLLIAQAVCPSLDHADLVVEALDEAERDLVVRVAVRGDAVPMTVDHLGKLLIRREPLPFQRPAPVLEEAPRPPLALVAPELAKGLFEG